MYNFFNKLKRVVGVYSKLDEILMSFEMISPKANAIFFNLYVSCNLKNIL